MDFDRLKKARISREYNAYAKRFSTGPRRGPDTYRPDLFIEKLKTSENPAEMKKMLKPVSEAPPSKPQPLEFRPRNTKRSAFSRSSRRRSQLIQQTSAADLEAETSQEGTPPLPNPGMTNASVDVTRAISLLEEIKKKATPEELVALHKALLPSKPSHHSHQQYATSSPFTRSRIILLPSINPRHSRRLEAEDWHPPTSTTREEALAMLEAPQEQSKANQNDEDYVQTGGYRHGTLRITNGVASPEPSSVAPEEPIQPLAPHLSLKLPRESFSENIAAQMTEREHLAQQSEPTPDGAPLETSEAAVEDECDTLTEQIVELPANDDQPQTSDVVDVLPFPDTAELPAEENSATNVQDVGLGLSALVTDVVELEANEMPPTPRSLQLEDEQKSIHRASQLSYEYASECLDLVGAFSDDEDARKSSFVPSPLDSVRQSVCVTANVNELQSCKGSHDSGYSSDISSMDTRTPAASTFHSREISEIASTVDSVSCYTKSPSLHSPRSKWMPWFGEQSPRERKVSEFSSSKTTLALSRLLPFKSASNMNLSSAAMKSNVAVKTSGPSSPASINSPTTNGSLKPHRLQKSMPGDMRTQRKYTQQTRGKDLEPPPVPPKNARRPTPPVSRSSSQLAQTPAETPEASTPPVAPTPPTEEPTTPTKVLDDLLDQHARTSVVAPLPTALSTRTLAGTQSNLYLPQVEPAEHTIPRSRSKSCYDLKTRSMIDNPALTEASDETSMVPSPLSLGYRPYRRPYLPYRPASAGPKSGMNEEAAAKFARGKSRDIFGRQTGLSNHLPRMATPSWDKSRPSMASNVSVEDIFPEWRSKSNSPAVTLQSSSADDAELYTENVPPMPELPQDVHAKALKADDVINRKRASPKRLDIEAAQNVKDDMFDSPALSIPGQALTRYSSDMTPRTSSPTPSTRPYTSRKFACSPRIDGPSARSSPIIDTPRHFDQISELDAGSSSSSSSEIDSRLAIPKSLMPESPSTSVSHPFRPLRLGSIDTSSGVFAGLPSASYAREYQDLISEDKENQPETGEVSNSMSPENKGIQFDWYFVDEPAVRAASPRSPERVLPYGYFPPRSSSRLAHNRNSNRSTATDGPYITDEQRKQIHNQLAMASLCGNSKEHLRSRAVESVRHPHPLRSSCTEAMYDRYSGGLSYGWDRDSGFVGSAGTRDRRAPSPTKHPRDSKAYGLDLTDVPVFLQRRL